MYEEVTDTHHALDEVAELVAIVDEKVYHPYRGCASGDIEPGREREKCSMPASLIVACDLNATYSEKDNRR